MNMFIIMARAFRGAIASTSVLLFLFIFVSLLQGDWLMGSFLPAFAFLLAVTAFPAFFVLALPLAAVIRHRGLGALAGAVWTLVLGSAIVALSGADVPTLFLFATLFVPSGAALGLGVAWKKG